MDPSRAPLSNAEYPPAYSEINAFPTATMMQQTIVGGVATTESVVPAHAFTPAQQPLAQQFQHDNTLSQQQNAIADDATTVSVVPGYAFLPAQQQHQHYQQYPSAPATDKPASGHPVNPATSGQPLNAGQQTFAGYGTMDGVSATQPDPPLVIHRTIVVTDADMRHIGACPVCRIGVLDDNYPCSAVFCAIFFFPLGLLCLLIMRNKRCSVCHMEFEL